MRFLARVLALCLMAGGAFAARTGIVDRLADHAQFLRMARTVDGDSYLKFLIDVKADTIVYLDAATFDYHFQYVQKLLPQLAPEKFDEITYLATQRRFLAGTLGYHSGLKRYSFEFWEGDRMTAPLLKTVLAKLQATACSKTLAFHPTSPLHEDLARSLKGIKVVTTQELYSALSFKASNPGFNVGRLRVLGPDENPDEAAFDPTEIVLLQMTPSDLTPVAGIITTRFTTPLSHVNLRAYAWKVPCLVLPDAVARYGALGGQIVAFRCDSTGHEVRPATAEEVKQFEKRHRARPVVKLSSDMRFKALPDLTELKKGDADRVGTKAANLGEMTQVDGLNVPQGFAVPFHYYGEFLTANGLDTRIATEMSEVRFRTDGAYRRIRLKEIQSWIRSGEHTAKFRKLFLDKVHANFEDRGLFVRSSTNSEDLPGFNGAGLYDSVPNARGDEALLEAVKTVWASVFNFKAYQERQHHGIDHATVRAAVACVASLDARAAGVLITTDIYDSKFPGSVTINAKKGLGLTVVDGKSIPEEVVYDPAYDAIRVISRSADSTELVVGPDGGVVEQPVEAGATVLSPDDVRLLGEAAAKVREVFKAEGFQDVEWVITEPLPGMRKAWVVQSRPYLGGGAAFAAPAPPATTAAPEGPRPRRARRTKN